MDNPLLVRHKWAMTTRRRWKTDEELTALAAALRTHAGPEPVNRSDWQRRVAPLLRSLVAGDPAVTSCGRWSWPIIARAVSMAGLGYGEMGLITSSVLQAKIAAALRAMAKDGPAGDGPVIVLPGASSTILPSPQPIPAPQPTAPAAAAPLEENTELRVFRPSASPTSPAAPAAPGPTQRSTEEAAAYLRDVLTPSRSTDVPALLPGKLKG